MKENEKKYYHLCNPTTFVTSGCVNIESKASLDKIKDDINSVYLVNIHLNWEGNKLSSNYGFDIANLIRTEKKSKALIIFYSPIQVDYFERKSQNEIKYKILMGRGSLFMEAPFKEEEFIKLAESIEPLSRAALHDVVTMLCNLKGIVIDKLNHDLKFEADIDKAISSITPYLSALQKSEIELDRFVTNLKRSVLENKPTQFNDIKQSFILLCNNKLTDQGNNTKKTARTKHKILLIDDLPSEIEKVKDNLKDDFIIETTTTGKEAISILSKDLKNEIVAVIADWRLFSDVNQNYWQPLQGYEVLDYASNNGIRSLFALTSQADFIVHQLRNLMGIRFSMFKKENLNSPDQWKLFSDVLFEACEQAFFLRKSIPTSKGWTNSSNVARGASYISLQQQYTEKWNSNDRDVYWNSIDDKCNEIWTWLEEERHNNYKDVYTLKVKYDLSLSADEPLLFPVLVLRRIWMALWYSKTDYKVISKEGVTAMKNYCFEVMFTGMNKNYNSSAPGADMNKLCLTVNEICARRMLPEERDWLIKQNLIVTE